MQFQPFGILLQGIGNLYHGTTTTALKTDAAATTHLKRSKPLEI